MDIMWVRVTKSQMSSVALPTLVFRKAGRSAIVSRVTEQCLNSAIITERFLTGLPRSEDCRCLLVEEHKSNKYL